MTLKIAILVPFVCLFLWRLAQAQYCLSDPCYSCYYRCQLCTGPLPTQCTSCFQNYIIIGGNCISCGQNCISCASSSQCQTCANQFYLSQSTGQCNACPTGAQTCTFSAIQQCLNGYYLQNSICFTCIKGCSSCSNSYSCTSCVGGFYLTSTNTCANCLIANCSNCDSLGNCQLCNSGLYGPSCTSLCMPFCSICDATNCYQCASGYYQSETGSCEALSVVCDQGNSPFSCYSCIQTAFLSSQYCLPYLWVDSSNKQDYYKPFNQQSVFNGMLNNCSLFSVSIASNTIQIKISIQPSFKIGITIQMATKTNSSTSIHISADYFAESYNHTILSTYGYECNGNYFTLSNFQNYFTPDYQDNTEQHIVTLFLTTNGLIGVTEVLVEQFLCLVEYCSQCLTAYTCQTCLPGIFLQNNQCVQECSSGYYLNSVLMSCSLLCIDGFFPILADYICQTCMSPCLSCLDVNNCLSCVSGWFLFGSTCLQSCPNGYYSNNKTSLCSYCQYPCANCIANASRCLSCSLGFLILSQNQCGMNCPLGYFANFSAIVCDPCDISCATCQLISTQCLSCHAKLFLNPNNTCLSSCDSIYVPSQSTNTCSKCIYPCITCINSVSNCLSCASGFLLNYSCVSLCPNGSYHNFKNMSCNSCLNNCRTCLSELQCLTCDKGYLYNMQEQTCIQVCPSGTYSMDLTCTLCQSPCNNCINDTYCIDCQGYLFSYFEGQCLLACPVGTFMALNNVSKQKICNSCGFNCSQCLSQTQCLHCKQSILLTGQCVNFCPNGTYSWVGVCYNCSFPCLTCQTTSICLSCVIGYVLQPISRACLRSCPNGFYSNSSICVICSPSCSICQDSTSMCLQCASGYYKGPTGCQDTCGQGYYAYPLQSICKKCSSNCNSCLTGSLCLSCKPSSAYKYLFRYSCLTSCPQGYYADLNSTCQVCSSKCISCFNSSTNCTVCIGQLFHASNLTPPCVNSCPQFTYPSSSSRCMPCMMPCLDCSSQLVCLSCSGLQFYLYNGKCLSSCPFGFYSTSIMNVSNICYPCDLSCLQCSGYAYNCTDCGPDLFLNPNPGNYTYKCSHTCPQYYYKDILNQVCAICQAPCLQCITYFNCLSCTAGLLLQFGTCLSVCSAGYFPIISVCSPCLSPCQTCLSSAVCQSCVSNYFFDEASNQCLSQCPTSTYAYETLNGELQCLSCSSVCQQCYDSSTCKSCFNNSSRPFLQASNCQTSCTAGYYNVSGSHVCQECGFGCLLCTNADICNSCSDSYLLNGTCEMKCPDKYYASISFTCQLCLSPCSLCFDASNCQTCEAGYFLYLTHCLVNCPTNQWEVLSLQICNSSCNSPMFKLSGSKQCVVRCAIYYDLDGYCVSNCPSNYIANSTFGCSSCAIADCTKKLLFQMIPLQINGRLKILMVFNLPLDGNASFSSQGMTLSLLPSLADPQQLQISALRQLQQSQGQQINTLTITDISAYKIMIDVDMSSQGLSSSGILELNVVNLSLLTVSGYPLQMQQVQYPLAWYQQSSGGMYAYYLGVVISATLILVLFINMIIDNVRAVIFAVDGIQTLHFLYYLNVWYHPYVENYMLGLKFSAMRALISASNDSQLWNCEPKYVLVYGQCNAYWQLILPILMIAVGLATCASKLIPIFHRKHTKLMTLANSTWWISGSSLGISSIKGISYGSSDMVAVCSVICIVYLCWSLILAYTIIKNVYSNYFEDKCFFWNLKQTRASQQLSNMHPFLLIVRRIMLVAVIGLTENTPLSCLFIITLLTICILSNIIINSPFKRYTTIISISQGLMAIFLILLQMYIVSAARLSNSSWNIFGIVLFITILCYSMLLLGLAYQETVYAIVRIYNNQSKEKIKQGVDKSKKGQNESIKQPKMLERQSNYEDSPKIEMIKQRDELQHDETQNEFIKQKQLLSQKYSTNSNIFQDDLKGAPKILHKISKDSKET